MAWAGIPLLFRLFIYPCLKGVKGVVRGSLRKQAKVEVKVKGTGREKVLSTEGRKAMLRVAGCTLRVSG